MIVLNKEEKYYSRVYIKARSVEILLLAAVYKFSIPKSKDWKTFTPTISIIIYVMKTMQRQITVKKCSSVLTIPNAVMGHERVHISFHVDIGNEILCQERGMSAVAFLSAWNFRQWKSVSLMEISGNPSTYLPIMLLFIHRRYELNYRIFYDQCADHKILVRKICIYFVLTVPRNRKFPYANHISYDWWKSVSK